MTDLLDRLLGPPPKVKPLRKVKDVPLSPYEKPAHLKLRDRWLASQKSVPLGARALVPPLHLHCQVPLAQIGFYLNVSKDDLTRWIKAATKRKPMNYSKWRPELNIYELLQIKVP